MPITAEEKAAIDAEQSAIHEAMFRPKQPITVAPKHKPLIENSDQLLLTDIEAYLSRFVVYPSEHERVAHVLWIAHTHLMEKWESTPRIAFLSTEPASGKSRALELTETLVLRPIEAINVTSSYLFRKVSDPDGLPTILFDEIDTIFGPKAKEHEEIRGILNAGHRRGAKAGRCVVIGKAIKTEELPAYCAVALAGLGNLPDTILTRSIVVRMRRRAPNEVVEPYRRRLHAPEGNVLRERLASWSNIVADSITDVFPKMPAGVEDRNADVWEPLLTVADSFGADWGNRARVAAVALVAAAKESTPSLGIRLLSDTRLVFGKSTALSTADLIEKLLSLDESCWVDMRGKPLDARRLSNYLKQYGIHSKTVRIGTSTPKGYQREDLHDAWSRYLGVSPMESATSATTATTSAAVANVAHVALPEWDDINA